MLCLTRLPTTNCQQQPYLDVVRAALQAVLVVEQRLNRAVRDPPGAALVGQHLAPAAARERAAVRIAQQRIRPGAGDQTEAAQRRRRVHGANGVAAHHVGGRTVRMTGSQLRLQRRIGGRLLAAAEAETERAQRLVGVQAGGPFAGTDHVGEAIGALGNAERPVVGGGAANGGDDVAGRMADDQFGVGGSAVRVGVRGVVELSVLNYC